VRVAEVDTLAAMTELIDEAPLSERFRPGSTRGEIGVFAGVGKLIDAWVLRAILVRYAPRSPRATSLLQLRAAGGPARCRAHDAHTPDTPRTPYAPHAHDALFRT
jgi:hypothetical protein